MSTIITTPIEENVILLETKAPDARHGSQYGLKFASAAISNMCASAVSNPVDVIKVSLCVNYGLRLDPDYSYLNDKTTLINARVADRFRLVHFQLQELPQMPSGRSGIKWYAVYSGLRLGTYEYFKDSIYSVSSGTLSRDGLILKVLGATVAATLGSFVANPADLVKVRMQAYYPNGRPYGNTFKCFASVWREGAHNPAFSSLWGGIRSLYRGVDATTARGIILSTSQICSYDQMKQTLKKKGVMEEGIGLHLTASLFAGLFCSITSNPVDVVKVRVMNDKERRYKGVFDCVRVIMVHEGPMTFFKGFGMCWARLGIHTIVSFLVFERIRFLLGISPM